MDDESGTRAIDTITVEWSRERARIILNAMSDLREGYGLLDYQRKVVAV